MMVMMSGSFWRRTTIWCKTGTNTISEEQKGLNLNKYTKFKTFRSCLALPNPVRRRWPGDCGEAPWRSNKVTTQVRDQQCRAKKDMPEILKLLTLQFYHFAGVVVVVMTLIFLTTTWWTNKIAGQISKEFDLLVACPSRHRCHGTSFRKNFIIPQTGQIG